MSGFPFGPHRWDCCGEGSSSGKSFDLTQRKFHREAFLALAVHSLLPIRRTRLSSMVSSGGLFLQPSFQVALTTILLGFSATGVAALGAHYELPRQAPA